MSSARPLRRLVKWTLLLALLIAGGVGLYRRGGWTHSPGPGTSAGNTPRPESVSSAAPAGTQAPANGKASPAPSAGPRNVAARPGSASGGQPSNPLPPIASPYDLEPEVDLSAHYVIIKGQRAHPYKVLAKYKTGVSADARGEVLGEMALHAQNAFPLTPDLVVLRPLAPQLAPVTSVAEAEARGAMLMKRIEALTAAGHFEYVEPDYIRTIDATPTDQAFTDGTLWGLRNTGQNGGLAGADIDAVHAWNTTTGSSSIVVAVIDTGVRYTHQDLATQMWVNGGEIAGNGVDDDRDGYIDNVYGINGITNSGDPADDHGHGTHCAGTIGAQANGGGPLVGVAWSVKLMACKFLSYSGSGSTSDAIKCINFAVTKGADVLSNSWGGGGFSQALGDSIAAAGASGVLFVAAAGNHSLDTDVLPNYPSGYAHENIVSVAALDRQDQLASFSNHGATTVDIGAPGVSIYSSVSSSDASYAYYSGTSMATPHVAGVAALVLANSPDISVAELKQRIFSGAVPVAALTGKCVTGARLNAYNALTGEPDGELEVAVTPADGAAFSNGDTVPFFVHVRDFGVVTNATVTAVTGGSTTLTFVNDGTGADATANDHIYSSAITLPASGASFNLQLQISAPDKTTASLDNNYTLRQPPDNDHFASRVDISGAATVTGHNLGATRETGEPAHAGLTGGKSVWWTWTAPADGNAAFRTTGSNFDTIMGVYTGSAVDELVMRGGDDDSGGDLTSLISMPVYSGTVYQIAVDGFMGASGDVTLATSFVAAPVRPVNDDFRNASVLSGGEAAATGDNLIATREAGEPYHAGNYGGRSVWWTWTAPADGVVTVTTDGSLFDTTLGIYSGTAPGALTALAADNDSGEGTRSLASFPAISGSVYRIAVDGFNGSSGTIALKLSLLTSPPAPANDDFASATVITLDGSSAAATGTNIGAGKQPGEPDHARNTGGRSIWWTWTAPYDGSVIINTTGSNFDTMLAVYTGESLDALTEIASNDQDTSQGTTALTSRVRFNVTAGMNYRIAVDGMNNGLGAALGNVSLNVTLSTIVLPPNDLFALRTNITDATATVTGTNIGASAETGEPYHYSQANKSVWWSWTAPSTGNVLMSATGADFLPVLAIYRGSSLASLSVVGQRYGSGLPNTTFAYIPVTAGTTYQIAVDSLTTYSTGGSFTLRINHPVPAPVIVTQPAAQGRYPGDSIYLSVQTEYSPVPLAYQWKKNGANLADGGRIWGSKESYLYIYDADLSDTGSYAVEVTNAGGTTTSAAAAISVTIPPPPVISAQPASQSVYIGDPIYLYVSLNYTGSTTFQWQRSTDEGATFTDIPNANSSYFHLYNSTEADFVRFRVIVTNPGGSTTSEVATITPLIPPPPVISHHPSPVTVQGGNGFSLHGYASGRGNITYRWQKDGIDVVADGRVQPGFGYLSVYGALLSDAGEYRFVASNAGGSVTSDAATVTVTTPPPPTILSAPTAREVTAGYGVSFNVYASGMGLRYQWQKDGVDIVDDGRVTGAKNYNLYIQDARATDAGQYRVIVSNEGGSATSTTAALTVHIPPPPTFYSHPTGLRVLEGDGFSLVGYAFGDGTLTYQWYKDEVPVADAKSTLYSVTATAADAGTYKLAATNAGGTVYSDHAEVIVVPGAAPVFVVQPEGGTCEAGDRVVLNASAIATPAATYQWYKNGAEMPGATATTLSFLATDADDGATFFARAVNLIGTADSQPAKFIVHPAGSGKVFGVWPRERVVGAGRVVYPLTIRTRAAWSAAKDANWISLSHGTGAGNHTLEVLVAPNPLPVERTAAITIGDHVHTLTQRAAGTPVRELWVTGDNSQGQLGDGSLPPSAFPTYAGNGIAAVHASADRSFVLKADGSLWGMGQNALGQLGDGTTVDRRIPTQVATGVRAVAAGHGHTMVLKTDDTLWACGINGQGQLGDGTTTRRLTPVQVATDVRAVAAGYEHTLILKNDGTLWACGSNWYGQLGDGSIVTRVTPVQVATNVRTMAAGTSHTLFIKNDDTLWGTGYNSDGQLAGHAQYQPVTPVQLAAGVKSVAAGGHSTLFITTDDTLWACGQNYYGQLGEGGSFRRFNPVEVATHVRSATIGSEHSLILKTDGTLWACGDNLYRELGDGSTLGRSLPVEVAADVAGMAVGDDHSLFVKTDGGYWVMGDNLRGQLGQIGGSVELRLSPVSVASEVQSVAAGQNHSLFIKADATAWTMGGNFHGQLADGSVTSRSRPVSIMGSVSAVSGGARHTAFLKADGALFTAGGNGEGQLGDGSGNQRTSPMMIASDVAGISAGASHTLAQKTSGALVGFGANTSGQLARSYAYMFASPVTIFTANAASASAGGMHSLFMETDGSVWAAGGNSYGQLGIGHTSSSYALTRVAGSYRAVAAGDAHSVFLKTDGTAWSAGLNQRGQLGDGSTTTRSVPVQIATAVRAIAAGGSHSLILQDDDGLWGFGDNSSGQLGTGTTVNASVPTQVARNVQAVAAGAGHTLFIADGDPRVDGYTAPGITSFSPATPSPGTTVTIRGAGFTDVLGVYFNNVAATQFTTISSTQITATAPETNLIPLTITVGTFDGVAIQNNPGGATTGGGSAPSGSSGGGGGGGGGAPSVWFLAAAGALAGLRQLQTAQRRSRG